MLKNILVFLFILFTWVSSYATQDEYLKKLLTDAESPTLTKSQKNTSVDLLIDQAVKRRNNEYICRGYLIKIIRAYNAFDLKEAKKWIELIEPLALQEKEYNMYFRAKQCYIDLMLIEGDLEKGEEESRKMLKKAKKARHQYGIILSHLCISHAYTMSFRVNLAVKELEKAYLISSVSDPNGINLEILHALIIGYDSLRDYPKQLKYIKQQESLLLSRIKEDPKKKKSTLKSLCLTYILFANHYFNLGDVKQTKHYLDLSKEYFSDDMASIYKAYYYDGYLNYYELTEDYKNALWCVDSVLDHASIESNQSIFLTKKARILWKNQLYKESSGMYEKAMKLQDSIYANLLNKQVARIQFTEGNDNVMLKKEQIQNYINISLLIAALASLMMLVFYIRHTIRIKKTLQKDEQKIRIMSRRMQMANIAKDKFLSNISQSIRAPLDTIVCNSKELADDKILPDDVKEELSDKIIKTSQELMLIINNILDLSRLESGMMKFSPEDFAPVSHIKLFLASSSDKNVDLFCELSEQESQSITTRMDQGRFSQLLESILTKEQNIGVSISMSGQSLCVSITGSSLVSGEMSQEKIIQNEINSLLIRHFGGTYEVIPERESIVITLVII